MSARPLSLRVATGGLFVLLVLFAALPLVAIGWRGLDADVGAILRDGANQQAFLRTIHFTVGAVLFSLVVGLPLGFLLGRSDLPRKPWWQAVLTIPYIVPPYVGAIAWMALLNPTNGLLNRVFAVVGLGALDIYTVSGMVWVEGLFLCPFVFLGTADALRRIDPALEEAARMAGAGPWRVLRDVTLPLVLPSIGAGVGFVAAAAAASFGVPYLLASGSSVPPFVLTTRIYQALALDPATGQPVAVVLSLGLLLVGLVVMALTRVAEGKRGFVSVGGKANRRSVSSLGRWRVPAELGLGLFAVAAVVVPLGTLIVTSLLSNVGHGLVPENFTLAHWSEVLLVRPDTGESLLRSFGLALAAGAVSVAVGTLLAWTHARHPTRALGGLLSLARLPWAVPGTVLALGLLLVFSQEIRVVVLERLTFSLVLLDTAWLIGIAYVVKFLAFPVSTAEAALKSLDPALEEAARLSGAGWTRVLRDVTLPLLAPSMATAFFLVVMPALSEVTMSILLFGPRTPVVGTVLFNLQAYADPPAAAVLAVVVAALVMVLHAASRRLSPSVRGA